MTKKWDPEGVTLGRMVAKFLEDALITAGCVHCAVAGTPAMVSLSRSHSCGVFGTQDSLPHWRQPDFSGSGDAPLP